MTSYFRGLKLGGKFYSAELQGPENYRDFRGMCLLVCYPDPVELAFPENSGLCSIMGPNTLF